MRCSTTQLDTYLIVQSLVLKFNNAIFYLDGIAVDWITQKLYWTDAGFRHIEVIELSSRYRKTIILTGSTTVPRAIVVDSSTR